MPALRDGEILLQSIWLSLDPYMRSRMNADGFKPIGIGDVMCGDAVSRVIETKNISFGVGDLVLGFTGWQTFAVSDGKRLTKVDERVAPVSTALGVLGMPGMTAYTGLLNIGKPAPGETLVVAAASGAVGSIVGQIAKLKGCSVIGIAGGPEKCRYVSEELGFDAALDHQAPDLPRQLAIACPNGIDIYFENVGGHVWQAVFPLLNDFARVPVCGLIAHYNDNAPALGPNQMPLLMRTILRKGLTLQGFDVSDFAPQEDDFRRDMQAWLRNGQIKYKEDVVVGLEKAPEAFIGLLKGRNFGKLLVKVEA